MRETPWSHSARVSVSVGSHDVWNHASVCYTSVPVVCYRHHHSHRTETHFAWLAPPWRRCVAPRVPPSHVPLRRHRSHGGILYMPLSVGGEESAKPGKKSHLLSGAPLAGLCALSEVATGLCAPVRRAPGSPRHRNRESPTSARPFVMPLLHARGPDASVTTNRTADTGFGLRMGMPD